MGRSNCTRAPAYSEGRHEAGPSRRPWPPRRSRIGIVWGAMGAARASYESALEYAGTRVQFDKPIAGFQLTQEKLVNMTLELSKGTLLALHLGRMKDEGRSARSR